MNMTSQPVEFNYHLLRQALDTYSKNIPQLSDEEYQQIHGKASQSFALESLVLASPEASQMVMSEAQVTQAVKQVAERYADHASFVEDLRSNQLDEDSLQSALQRELLFDAVMQRVALEAVQPISEAEIDEFYQAHTSKFVRPEKRAARHILITINADYPENTPEAARQRMDNIEQELAGKTSEFATFAARYSECPTAMQGGELGEVARGQLYSELDAALFEMAEGSLSRVLESDVGLHILFCDTIIPGQTLSLEQVKPRIQALLVQRQQRAAQKTWLNRLQHGEH